MNENESKKVPEVVLAPLTGKAVPLSEVSDHYGVMITV